MSFCTTIAARRRREVIQEQLRKNRAKTQELLEARRKSIMEEEKQIKGPEDRNNWTRASGDCICASCKKSYYDHPHVDEESWLFPGDPWLNRLCDGSFVKL